MQSQYKDSDTATMTSVSRSHKAGSTVSRNKSLIMKNTQASELKPSDILIDRFTAWKRITKMLIGYFEGIADIENNTARELTKLGAVIQVPFQAGNQFLGEDGVQDVFYSIRDKTRVIADSHASLAKTVEGSIVQHLQKLRAEIKAHVKNVQNDTGRLAASVAKEREMSTKHISDLAKAITMLKNTPMAVVPKDDPYAQNTLVLKQLQKQVNEENALQKSIIIMQQNSAHFEEGIVRSIQSAWSTFDEWQGRMSATVQETWKHLGVAMAQMEPDREWISFAARSDHLLDPETPLRNPDYIDYPGKDDPSVVPVHVGLLERKKRFTKTYKEAYYVLTPAGYLHEYATSDPYSQQHPVFSLFLPACTLGPPSSAHTATSHKFHIEGKRSAAPHQSAGGHMPFKIPGQNETAYTFRSRSHDEMMEWWNDLRMLVARYLVASEQLERSGPVAAAVRSAGYRSEEDESEGEGSSIEEDEDDELLEEQEGVTMHENHAPIYEHEQHAQQQNATAGSSTAPALEMGANGYPVDKKPAADPAPSSANNHVATSASSNYTTSYPANSHTTTGDSLPNHIELGNPTGIATPSAPINSADTTVGISDATGAPSNASTTGPVADEHAVDHNQSRFSEGTEGAPESVSSTFLGRFSQGLGLTK